MLGIREPEIYGKTTYDLLIKKIENYCCKNGIALETYQSNSEGELVDKIQQAINGIDGIVFNPAAYTHTSIAILDALKAVKIPTVEVHISGVDNRDDFRKTNYIRQACIFSVQGMGIDGYLMAIDKLIEYYKDSK